MIKLENTEVVGWESAIRGMRNPMNSWEKSDSGWSPDWPIDNYIFIDADIDNYFELAIGPNDQKLMTYSFPCQDLSVAGKQQGMSKGSGTRSGLLWEVERLLNETEHLPQLLLMENVPQVHSKKNKGDFENWIRFLENKGYSNYWQDLNAKDYGVAQNRNRCFMVSILGNYCFYFPKPHPLTKRMVDYLEDSVDEKYYIDNEKSSALIKKLIDNGTLSEESVTERQKVQELSRLTAALNYRRIDKVNLSLAKTLCARDYKGFGTGFDTMNGVIECK